MGPHHLWRRRKAWRFPNKIKQSQGSKKGEGRYYHPDQLYRLIGWLKAANVVLPSLAPHMSMDVNVLEYVQRTESHHLKMTIIVFLHTNSKKFRNIYKKSIPYTAVTVGLLGFYKCICMPFRLTNAPATFQRLMESCLRELHLQYCIIYLDDTIIFSKTPEEHLHQLKLVFQKISEAGLKLKPSKCEVF